MIIHIRYIRTTSIYRIYREACVKRTVIRRRVIPQIVSIEPSGRFLKTIDLNDVFSNKEHSWVRVCLS